MKKILITGAAGALGKAVTAHLNASRDLQVILTGRHLVEGMLERFVCCDLCNSEQLAATLESVQPDIILHLAATFTGSLEDAYKVNVEPARQILEYVERNGCKVRVLLIGSAAEYGVVQPEENPISEEHVLFPVSVYGVTKAWQTQLIGLYAGRGVDVLCARIFNLLGPGISDRLFAGRVQRQIQEVLGGQKTVIEVGSLAALRDYVSLDDAARQLFNIVQYGVTGEIYHVGSGVPVAMGELLHRQLELHGLNQSIVLESPGFSNRQGYDVPIIFADMKKTEALAV